MAKLIFLSKREVSYIERAVSYLTTRVSKIDEDNWMKLRRFFI